MLFGGGAGGELRLRTSQQPKRQSSKHGLGARADGQLQDYAKGSRGKLADAHGEFAVVIKRSRR